MRLGLVLGLGLRLGVSSAWSSGARELVLYCMASAHAVSRCLAR